MLIPTFGATPVTTGASMASKTLTQMTGKTPTSTPSCPAGQQWVASVGKCAVVSQGCAPPNVPGGSAGCVTPAQVLAAGHPEYDPLFGFVSKGLETVPNFSLIYDTTKNAGFWRPFVPVQDSVYGNLIPAVVPDGAGSTFLGLRTRDPVKDPIAGQPRTGTDQFTLQIEDPWPRWFYGAKQSQTATPDLSGSGKTLNAYDTALRNATIASIQPTDPVMAAAISNGSTAFAGASLILSDDGTTTTAIQWQKYFGPATNNVLVIQSEQVTYKDIDPIGWIKNPLKTLVAGAQVIASAVGACSTFGKGLISSSGSSGKVAAGVLCPGTPPPPVCQPPYVYDASAKACVNVGGAVYPMGSIARLNTSRNVWSVYVPMVPVAQPQPSSSVPVTPPSTPPATAGLGFHPHGGGGGHHGGGHGHHGHGGAFFYDGPWTQQVYSYETCPSNYDPVIGSDGRTYRNACYAMEAGVRVVRSARAGGLGDPSPGAPPGSPDQPNVTPAIPPGTYYAGQQPTQPPGTINGGTESDVAPFYKTWWFWAAVIGGAAAIGTSTYYLTKKRRRTPQLTAGRAA